MSVADVATDLWAVSLTHTRVDESPSSRWLQFLLYHILVPIIEYNERVLFKKRCEDASHSKASAKRNRPPCISHKVLLECDESSRRFSEGRGTTSMAEWRRNL